MTRKWTVGKMDSVHNNEAQESGHVKTLKGDHVIVEQLSPCSPVLPSSEGISNVNGSDSQLLTLLSLSAAAAAVAAAASNSESSEPSPNSITTSIEANGHSEHETSTVDDGYTQKKAIHSVDRKSGISKKSIERRVRTTFSSNQTIALEKAYQEKQYLSSEERIQLAKGLGIQEHQVKVWFQNRRTKSRRTAWRSKREGANDSG